MYMRDSVCGRKSVSNLQRMCVCVCQCECVQSKLRRSFGQIGLGRNVSLCPKIVGYFILLWLNILNFEALIKTTKNIVN